MANYLVTDTELTSIADAIRSKAGTSTSMAFPDAFVSTIEGISVGSNSADDFILNHETMESFEGNVSTIGAGAFAYAAM